MSKRRFFFAEFGLDGVVAPVGLNLASFLSAETAVREIFGFAVHILVAKGIG